MFLNIKPSSLLGAELLTSSEDQRRIEYLTSNELELDATASLPIGTEGRRVDIHRSNRLHPYDSPSGPGHQHALLVFDEDGAGLLVSGLFRRPAHPLSNNQHAHPPRRSPSSWGFPT